MLRAVFEHDVPVVGRHCIRLSPLNQRRLENFKNNKRAYWSLWVFCGLLLLSLLSELLANDRPLLVIYDGALYTPTFVQYAETRFGGDFETEADYRDPAVRELIQTKGWMIWPPVRYSYDTVNFNSASVHPSPPAPENWLGTDDQGRDVFARALYGFRVSVLFGLALAVVSLVIGVVAGAVQGYFGGWVDLMFQRVIEVWENLPQFYLLIIMSSFIVPGLFSIFIILALFSWIQATPIVRAEVLKARNLDYVRAAHALGVNHIAVMFRHVLPNALTATVTLLPFILTGSIVALTSLDFLGFGLPPGAPSLGEMLQQGRNNLNAPWLGVTAFTTLSVLLSLLAFIGEGVRDAMDPRKAIEQAR